MALTKVTRSGITDNSINASKIEDGTIVDADITPGTITNAKLAGSITNAKLANSSITINGSAISLGGSVTAGKVEWQSVVVSDGSTVTTMVAGRGYFVDNNSAAGLVKLPASASAGDTIAIKDYRGNFGTNSLTIQRNSHKIQGETVDSELSTDRASVTLVYVDTTRGWLYSNESNVTNFASAYIEATGGTVTTDGNFKIHAFTGDGTFCVTAGRGDLGVADYVVVAGGGGGGRDDGGGGGGGGFRSSHTCTALKLSITPGAIPVTVGGGGSGGDPGGKATAGSNSVFSTITSAGGGGAGDGNDTSPTPAMNGGSGGGQGGAGPPSPACAVGGTGNTPPVSPPQGNNGGTGACKHNSGGGGGGANAVGSNSPPSAGPGTCNGRGGSGGAGANAIPVFGDSPKPYYPSTPNGPDATFSGGGGGSANATAGSGGSGGGGSGKNAGSPSGVGSSANANHGGGGGGGSNHPGPRCGGAGGKGIVLIRYQFQAS